MGRLNCYNEKYVTTIEGNTSLDRVQQCTYDRNHSTIDGYGSNGGEPIEAPKPPTESEIERVLLDYYREFLDTCYLVIPSTDIILNHEFTIPVPPRGKIAVEASGETTGFPPVDFVFKYTFCIKMEGGGTSVFEPVFAFVEEHQKEFAMVGVALIGVVLIAIAVKVGLISGGIAALAEIIALLLQNASKLVFG